MVTSVTLEIYFARCRVCGSENAALNAAAKLSNSMASELAALILPTSCFHAQDENARMRRIWPRRAISWRLRRRLPGIVEKNRCVIKKDPAHA
jgi:hypothetical protein